MRLALFLAVLSISGESQAATWVHFADCGSPQVRRVYWYDSKSIRSRGPVKLVRIRGDYSKVAGSPVGDIRSTWSLNCNSGRFSELGRSEYKLNGNVALSTNKATKPARVALGSVASKLMDVVCR